MKNEHMKLDAQPNLHLPPCMNACKHHHFFCRMMARKALTAAPINVTASEKSVLRRLVSMGIPKMVMYSTLNWM